MEQKELKISVPEGYEIDQEKSTFENIVFKPVRKYPTYKDVAEKLFRNKETYYYTVDNNRVSTCHPVGEDITTWSNCSSINQLQWIASINKLQNVAVYLNEDWKPHWNRMGEGKHYLYYREDCGIGTNYDIYATSGRVYFKSNELARQAVEILGEETIKTALGVYLYD